VGVPHFVWDGTGENPYYAFLAAADAIVTTEDSVTEAAGTGKPVYVQRLKGGSTRIGHPPADAGAPRNPTLRGQNRIAVLRAD
jgi:hypothetical protein